MVTEAEKRKFEMVIANLLRIGVLAAAVVVLAGGLWHLLSAGGQFFSFSSFQGEPRQLRHPGTIVTGVLSGGGSTLVQLGLLILIATPVARVVFSLAAFAHQRDRLYVAITAVVLVALTFSLAGG